MWTVVGKSYYSLFETILVNYDRTDYKVTIDAKFNGFDLTDKKLNCNHTGKECDSLGRSTTCNDLDEVDTVILFYTSYLWVINNSYFDHLYMPWWQ